MVLPAGAERSKVPVSSTSLVCVFGITGVVVVNIIIVIVVVVTWLLTLLMQLQLFDHCR